MIIKTGTFEYQIENNINYFKSHGFFFFCNYHTTWSYLSTKESSSLIGNVEKSKDQWCWEVRTLHGKIKKANQALLLIHPIQLSRSIAEKRIIQWRALALSQSDQGYHQPPLILCHAPLRKRGEKIFQTSTGNPSYFFPLGPLHPGLRAVRFAPSFLYRWNLSFSWLVGGKWLSYWILGGTLCSTLHTVIQLSLLESYHGRGNAIIWSGKPSISIGKTKVIHSKEHFWQNLVYVLPWFSSFPLIRRETESFLWSDPLL